MDSQDWVLGSLMPHYGRTYDRLARQAVSRTTTRLETFVESLRDAGLPDDQILDRIISDLTTDGPIFGGFFGELGSAGESSIIAAQGQGQSVGHVSSQANLKELLTKVGITDVDQFVSAATSSADPDTAFDIEQVTKSNRFLVWVAVLQNTCHACLPLHGVRKSAEEWDLLGLNPSTIHADNDIINRSTGGANPCYCLLVEDTDQTTVLKPLQRVRKEDGISKGTVRSVGSKNIGVAQKARDKALESKIGRRTLRLLGQVNKGEESD
jgi:hypothetical protein